MKRRRCGTSELELPVLGVGCWSFGGGDYWGAQDQSEADAVVAKAIEAGCNYFDTAEVYNDGASEASLGNALARLPELLGGRREEAVIGTKISPSNTEPGVLREHCEASLGRLRTDCIDLYMVHWPIHPEAIRQFTGDERIVKNPTPAEDAFGMLAKLQEEGKVRHVGVSNFGVKQLTEALATGAKIVVNQLAYSLLMRAIEVEILPFCVERGIGIIGYMPLMQGVLTGKYRTPDEVPPKRARIRHFSGSRPGSRHGEPGAEKETFEALERIREVAERQGNSMSALAIAWSVAKAPITCTLAGARNGSQLEANARAACIELAPEVVEELDTITAPILKKLGASPDYFENSAKSRTW